ncbi:hypothetical protein E308F_30520 [Moorella sp. E308F]|uniref:putative PDDEXK endonuclease n=1 Tax=Moorella sp. E308F TaxID=2572682 RepID=UPI0010FFBD3C|nr:hypothetical protein [Moorella sp. E308F]GEA16806.1 hypothetical protein E308F_30520 [Moorella sp. E308F]
MATERQRKSKIQERRITKSLAELGQEAKRQVASGALWFAKSDVVSEIFQVECKTKIKPSKSITLQKVWFDKIYKEALQAGKIPAVVISFGDGEDYFCIRAKDLYSLLAKEAPTNG